MVRVLKADLSLTFHSMLLRILSLLQRCLKLRYARIECWTVVFLVSRSCCYRAGIFRHVIVFCFFVFRYNISGKMELFWIPQWARPCPVVKFKYWTQMETHGLLLKDIYVGEVVHKLPCAAQNMALGVTMHAEQRWGNTCGLGMLMASDRVGPLRRSWLFSFRSD